MTPYNRYRQLDYERFPDRIPVREQNRVMNGTLSTGIRNHVRMMSETVGAPTPKRGPLASISERPLGVYQSVKYQQVGRKQEEVVEEITQIDNEVHQIVNATMPRELQPHAFKKRQA